LADPTTVLSLVTGAGEVALALRHHSVIRVQVCTEALAGIGLVEPIYGGKEINLTCHRDLRTQGLRTPTCTTQYTCLGS
jgi:hypothetical protein